MLAILGPRPSPIPLSLATVHSVLNLWRERSRVLDHGLTHVIAGLAGFPMDLAFVGLSIYAVIWKPAKTKATICKAKGWFGDLG